MTTTKHLIEVLNKVRDEDRKITGQSSPELINVLNEVRNPERTQMAKSKTKRPDSEVLADQIAKLRRHLSKRGWESPSGSPMGEAFRTSIDKLDEIATVLKEADIIRPAQDPAVGTGVAYNNDLDE